MSHRKYQDLRDQMHPEARARVDAKVEGYKAQREMADRLQEMADSLVYQLKTDRQNTDLLMLLGYYTFRIAELRA